MELSSQKPFNLVIDEFQEFYNINESVYSDMQNIWDTYRKKSKIEFDCIGFRLFVDAENISEQ